MKLFYYHTKVPSKNFGDEINPWLWPRLMPVFDDCRKSVFIGIGTVLNGDTPDWIKQADHAIFFSTGAGYGRELRLKPQRNWRIYCVRGPLSAKRLKLDKSLAIADGAVLLKRFFSPVPTEERTYRVSYMPHFRHGNPTWLKTACRSVGIHYIDPAGNVEHVISEISNSRLLISEAMHGAIMADTLRVPWLPVRTHPKILPFKWLDWCASIAQPYRPQLIRGMKPLVGSDYLYAVRLFLQRQYSYSYLLGSAKMATFSTLFQRNSQSNHQVDSCLTADDLTDKSASNNRQIDRLGSQLLSLTSRTPFLSKEQQLESLVTQLEARLEALKRDIRAGTFA